MITKDEMPKTAVGAGMSGEIRPNLGLVKKPSSQYSTVNTRGRLQTRQSEDCKVRAPQPSGGEEIQGQDPLRE